MQRKRTRDFYGSSSVDLGNSLMNAAPMRKLTMKRLIKWIIVVIILYVLYSIYSKSQMASPTKDDYDTIYNNNGKQIDLSEDDGLEVPKDVVDERVKEKINQVFEDLKKKQELKDKREAEKDVFQDYRDELGEVDKGGVDKDDGDNVQDGDDEEVRDVNEDDNIELNGDGNDADAPDDDNNIFGYDDDDNDNVGGHKEEENLENIVDADDFEPLDEKKEQEDMELEKEIEELLADAFKEAEKEVKDEVEENEMKIADGNNAAADGAVKPTQNNMLRIEKQKAEMEYRHQLEFNQAVKQMGQKLRPAEIRHLNDVAKKKGQQNDDDHELPPFVTAVRQSTIDQVVQLVASIQLNMPGRKVYVYDLDLTKTQKKELMSYCGVRVRLFMKSVFPKHVRNLDNLHWKALIMQTALAEFGHITWINPQYRLGTHEVAPLVHESHEQGLLVVGQKASYSTFSATHPEMLKFIPTDKKKLTNTPHIEIRAIMIHNTEAVHENIMKVFTACALEENCMAPPGAKWKCRFDFTGRQYADCHRFDESALNILLKNWFNYDMNLFARGNNYFRSYDPTYRPKLKQCRNPKDIRDNEL